MGHSVPSRDVCRSSSARRTHGRLLFCLFLSWPSREHGVVRRLQTAEATLRRFLGFRFFRMLYVRDIAKGGGWLRVMKRLKELKKRAGDDPTSDLQ